LASSQIDRTSDSKIGFEPKPTDIFCFISNKKNFTYIEIVADGFQTTGGVSTAFEISMFKVSYARAGHVSVRSQPAPNCFPTYLSSKN